MVVLKVYTACSASPFERGWYGEVRECRIPFLSMNSLKSSLINAAPLSDINCSGKPCIEKIHRRMLIVLSAEVELTT